MSEEGEWLNLMICPDLKIFFHIENRKIKLKCILKYIESYSNNQNLE